MGLVARVLTTDLVHEQHFRVIREGVGQLEMGKINMLCSQGRMGQPGDRLENTRGFEFLPKPRASACLLIEDRSQDLEKGRMVGPDYHSWAFLTVAMTTSCGAHEEIPFVLI